MKALKKLICLLMALAVVVVCIPVVSASTTLTVAGGEPGQAELIYSVESSYEVVIPESIGLNQPYTFEATKMNLRDDEQLNIFVGNYDALALTNSSGIQIGVTLNADNHGIVGSFYNGDTASRIQMIANADTYDKPAGDYTGTATFELNLTSKE